MSQNTIRYCKICGGVIDAKTKKCDQCGKQYFKWTKNKTVIALLSLLLICSIVLNIVQFDEIDSANLRFEYWRNEAERLEELKNTAMKLVEASAEDYKIIKFYSTYAAIVTEDSKMYHVYGCENLDESAPFYIYNISTAKSKGYYPCPKCHD